MLSHNGIVTLALSLASFISPFLYAAAPILSPIDTDLIRDRQERLLKDQQKRLNELQQLPNNTSVSKPKLTEQSRCFVGRCRPDIIYQTPDGKWALSK